MNKKELNGKIKEQSYMIEAQNDEIAYLKGEVAEKHEKLWAVIQKNDRLTMTYEPYRPPGDEYEGLTFYELIEENNSLTKNILDKIDVIKELDEELRKLGAEVRGLKLQLLIQKNPPKEPVKKGWRSFVNPLSR